MTIFKNISIPLFLLCSILCFSCSKEDKVLKTDIQFKNLDLDYNVNDLREPSDNNIAKLGRVLFYDTELSLNSTVSCGSCHKQEFAFADNVAKSEGFLGGLTNRNTPNLINSKFNSAFFWDSRTLTFSNAVTMPIFDHKEMGMTPEALIDRLSKLDYYDDLFKDAFGSKKVSGPRITVALVEFVGSIISADAKIDRVLTDNLWLDNDTRRGMRIFKEHCNDCHAVFDDDRGPDNPYLGVPSSNSFSSNSNSSFRNMVDIGLTFETSESLLENQFLRIPSLRNITSTAPYMHDGRFETLMDVIEHYDEDVTERDMVDERLLDEDGELEKLNLTQEDKENLVSFLETLTDPAVEQAEKYSNPFK